MRFLCGAALVREDERRPLRGDVKGSGGLQPAFLHLFSPQAPSPPPRVVPWRAWGRGATRRSSCHPRSAQCLSPAGRSSQTRSASSAASGLWRRRPASAKSDRPRYRPPGREGGVDALVELDSSGPSVLFSLPSFIFQQLGAKFREVFAFVS